MTLFQGPHDLPGLKVPRGEPFTAERANTGDDAEGISEAAAVTIGGRQTVWYNLEDQSVLQSWLAPSYMKITSGVNSDSKGRHSALVNGDTVIGWEKTEQTEKENRLEKMEAKAEFRGRKAFQLLRSSDFVDTYVVLEDGTVQSIDTLDEEVSPAAVLPQGYELVHSWLREVDGRGAVTHLCRRKKDKSDRALITGRLTLDPDSGRTQFGDVRRKTLDESVAAVDVAADRDVVFVVGKDGELKAVGLDDNGDGEHGRIVCRVGEAGSDLQPVVVQFDADYLCVAAGSALKLVSVPFGTVVAEVDLGAPADTVFVVGSRIMARRKGDDALAVVSVSTAGLPRSVASIIGCAKKAAVATVTPGKSGETVNLYVSLPEKFNAKNVKAVGAILDRRPLPDIPELLVLGIIEFLFTLDDGDLDRESGDPARAAVRRERLLCKAFNLPVAEALMSSYLSQVEFPIVIRMLEFVTLSLKLMGGEGHSERFLRQIEWIAMLLNAHYANFLLLSKEDERVEALLEDALEVVSTLETVSGQLGAVLPLAKMVKDGVFRESRLANTTYCVEVLDL